MYPAILKFRIHPFDIATGIKKIAVFQMAVVEATVLKDESLLADVPVLIDLHRVTLLGWQQTLHAFS